MVTQEKKIRDEDVESINKMFRAIFILVGLRHVNYPNDIETLFLHQHLKENFGGHSVSEIQLAFKKAINGELILERDEIHCYENFSPLYLSRIINAYRIWAIPEFRRLEKHIPPSESDQKLLQGPPPSKHFGKEIEEAYQHFLSFGEEQVKYFPSEFYNQLETDGVFKKDLYRRFMKFVRKLLVGDLRREKVKMEMAANTLKGERRQFAESIRLTNVTEIDKKISNYLTGKNDGEIALAAKQYCVVGFFKERKSEGIEHIYIPK